MQVKLGSIVTEVSGSLGGTTATRSHSGTVFGNKTNPVDTHSNAQRRVRNRIGVIAGTWRSLTQAQRNRWYNTEILGFSGFDLYRAINYNRMTISQSLLSTPLISPIAFQTSSITGFADASSIVMRITTAENIPANNVAVLNATPMISPGLSHPGKRLVFIRNLNSVGANTFNFGPQYVARFGPIRANGTYFASIFFIRLESGIWSQPLSVKIVAQA